MDLYILPPHLCYYFGLWRHSSLDTNLLTDNGNGNGNGIVDTNIQSFFTVSDVCGGI